MVPLGGNVKGGNRKRKREEEEEWGKSASSLFGLVI